MRRALLLASAIIASAALAPRVEAQAPNTDIFLASLSRRGDSLIVGPATNITHRDGYDNQPSFLPDGSGLLYTMVGTDAQADIWRYDIANRRSTRVTTTPESEYSATVMPGGTRFSVIRVERDSTQRLWSFALDGSDPRLVLSAVRPVGYHAWLGPDRLALFVLGTPSTLHVIRADGTDDEIRARDIGRALHRIPGQSSYSFTQRDSAKALHIVSQRFDGGDISPIALAPADNEYHAWTPDGTLLSATNGVIVRWAGRTGVGGEWRPIATLSGVKNVSRLAVSPDGRWLAFVAEPTAAP